MPITGRTPKDCFDTFRNHVGALVAKVVPTHCPILLERAGDRRVLTFKNRPHDDAIELQTRDGSVFLYMAQTLLVEPDEGRFRLRTIEYAYKLYSESPAILDDAVLRWEYVAKPKPHDDWCRNHLQFGRAGSSAIDLSLVPGAKPLDLKTVHLPTGWVLMEEVFRFLIHELGMKPPCGAEWPRVLHESDEKFQQRFSR